MVFGRASSKTELSGPWSGHEQLFEFHLAYLNRRNRVFGLYSQRLQ